MRTNHLKLPAAIAALCCVLSLIHVFVAQTSKSDRQAEAALEAAINREFVDGDQKGAIAQYQQILKDYSSRGVAANALLRMGLAYQDLGRTEEARKTYERLASEYANDQPQAMAEARMRLKALSNTSSISTPAAPKGPMQTSILSSSERGLWEAVTPDGRYISDGRPDHLTLRDLQTGKERVVTNSGASGDRVEHIAFSNDSKRMAYTWFAASSGSYELRTLPLDATNGTQPSVLLRDKTIRYSVPFGWSPDNKTVFAILTDNDGGNRIAAVSAATGAVRTIKPMDWCWPDKLSVSPDGRFIAYDKPVEKDSTNRDIFVLSIEDGTESPIVQDAARDALPVWTPDGKAVVFTSDSTGTVELRIVQVTDGKAVRPPVPLRHQASAPFPLGFTSSGSFYFASGANFTDVYTGGLGIPSARIEGFSGRNSNPAYSPDGKDLAYFSQRDPGFLNAESGVNGFLTIVVRSLDTLRENAIPTAFTETGGPEWFPDQKSLVFAGRLNASQPYTLHRIDLQNDEDLIRQAIETDPGSPVCVSPDGETIYFAKRGDTGKPRVMKYQVKTRREDVLFEGASPDGTIGRRFAISRDGQQIALTLRDGQPTHWTIQVMPVNGGPSTELQDPSAPQFAELAVIQWSIDRKEVLVQRANANGVLWWIPIDGGTAHRNGGAGAQFPAIQSIHPDGKRFAFTRSESHWEVSVAPDLLRPNSDSTDIFMVKIDPNGAKVHGPAIRLTQNLVFWDESPTWSPDGNFVAFKRRHLGAGAAGGSHDVVIRSVETGEENTWYDGIGTVPPRWFRDGASLLVKGNTEIVGRLIVGSPGITGTAWTNSSADYAGYGVGAISADDKSIYLPARERQNARPREGVNVYDRIAVLDLASGDENRSFSVLGRVSSLTLSPDGRTLALVSFDDLATGQAHLAKIGIDGKGYQPLLSFQSKDGAQMNPVWTKDGSGILFAQLATDDRLRIMWIATTGGKPEFTGLTIGRHASNSIDLSPDGTRLIFSAKADTISLANSR